MGFFKEVILQRYKAFGTITNAGSNLLLDLYLLTFCPFYKISIRWLIFYEAPNKAKISQNKNGRDKIPTPIYVYHGCL